MALSIKYITQVLAVSIIAIIIAFVISKWQLIGVAALLGLPLAFGFVYLIFKKPIFGMFALLVASFISNGLIRYIPAPLGLTIDVLLVLTFVAVFFQKFENAKWDFLKKNLILNVILVWIVYCFLQILNPESISKEAWFYAMRGVAFYFIMTIVLAWQLMEKPQALSQFINVWLFFSCMAALYGIKQMYLGLDGSEKAWLDAGNATTHILHGKLRVFSFYSDAGQFGASMAHAGLVAMIMAVSGKISTKHRLWYSFTAALCFYGMAISGTRGALFVPLAGGIFYLFLSKNFKVLTLGFVVLGILFSILKFTYIGQGNYQVQRMRSALDPNDPSLLVRLENQKKISNYLSSRPLGGGIGTAGYWGLKFSPNTFLAQTPTDSWYVKIWAETGIVGLTIYIGMILTILIYFFLRIWRMPPSELRQQLLALYAGVVGIAAASYGNQVLGQMPTGTVFYISIAFLYARTKFSSEK